jgi:class 3 adenylate cyclase
VKSAARIAGGDLETGVEDLGRNELGDLGRQLDGVAHQLEAGEQAIIDEEQDIIDLLSALLPGRLVDRVRQGEDAIGDIIDTATVVSITVDGMPSASGADQDLALEITERLDEEMQALMSRYRIERIQRSPGSQLYLSGLNSEGTCAADAAMFALAARDMVVELGTEFGQVMSARAGMAAGDVATGVLGTNQLSFGVWGDPPGMAVTLVAHARPGQVLADRSVTDELDGDWDLGPLEEFTTLADDVDAQVINGRVGAPSGS